MDEVIDAFPAVTVKRPIASLELAQSVQFAGSGGPDRTRRRFRRWNGALLAFAESAGFAIFVTMDKGVEYEQNLAGMSINRKRGTVTG